MLKWPDKSIDALTYLFRGYNDIDVYVEDIQFKTVYEILINRILLGNSKVRSVFPLNGKNGVLKKCREDQGNKGRKRIYIIDGDLDLILGKKKDNLKRLYRLNCYCMENLLICEHSICQIVYESDGSLTEDEIRKKLKYSDWKKSITRGFGKLYAIYAVCYENRILVPTTSKNALAFCSGRSKNRSISREKISDEFHEIRAVLKTHMLARDIDRRVKEIYSELSKNKDALFLYLSGKTCVLPLLHLRVKQNFRFPDSGDSMKGRLSRHCDLTIDPNLVGAVQAVARGKLWL